MPPWPHDPRRSLSPPLAILYHAWQLSFADLHGALYLAPRLPILDVLAAVIFVLALAKADFELRLPRRREIKPQGHQCQTLLLSPTHKLIDLPAMQEQLARPQRVVIHDIAVTVRADMT